MAKRKLQKTGPKPRAPKDQWVTVNVKMPPADLRLLKRKAKEFTDGNLSQWIRFAGRDYKP